MTDTNIKNPLGEKPVKELLKQFALPSIVAMLVGSLYNIVDQFFIGQSVGPLGNAATTIAYPLTICCIAIALLFGIGGASAFNLAMGMEKKDEAPKYIGNAALMMFIFGSVLAFFSIIFDETLLTFFGSPEDVLPYAKTYLKITAFGFPFLILSSGGG
ncbi:MAG: MATE family efflux transporter, partial [Eubacterium sp.]|nr:MATE family efflux transporter [Eubacterium sp.]